MTTIARPRPVPPVGEPAPAFQQRLGLFDATMLVAGTMIGSGIFIVSAEIARDTGTAPWLLAIWVLTGVMTIIGALSYAELAAMMPHAGGQYVYLREAYSPLWGFLYGWTVFLIIQTGSIAAVAVAFAKFLGVLVPWLGTDPKAGAFVLCRFTAREPLLSWHMPGREALSPVWQAPEFEFVITAGQGVAVLVIILLTWLNCRGIQTGKWVQNLFTIAKTLALVALIAIGIGVAARPGLLQQNLSQGWQGITQTGRFQSVANQTGLASWTWLVALMVAAGAMTGSLFSADAWNNITFTAGEVKNPRRNLAWSMALGTSMVITLYLLANVAYLSALPLHGSEQARELVQQAEQAGQEQDFKAQQTLSQELRALPAYDRGVAHAADDRVGTAVLEQVSPRFGLPLMALAIMVSTFGCVNGMTLMGARMYYAMARDGLFFQSVGRLSRRGVPAAGLILQGVWSILLVFSGEYNRLLDYVMFAVLLFYALTVIGLFVLRRKRPDAERPYRAIGYPIVPAIYVLLCTIIMLDLLVVRPMNAWPGLIIVLTGIPVYFLWRLAARQLPA